MNCIFCNKTCILKYVFENSSTYRCHNHTNIVRFDITIINQNIVIDLIEFDFKFNDSPYSVYIYTYPFHIKIYNNYKDELVCSFNFVFYVSPETIKSQFQSLIIL